MSTGGLVYQVNPENIIISSFFHDNYVDVQVYSRRVYL